MIVILYAPVIHRGYIDFLSAAKAQDCYVMGDDALADLGYKGKEIRAVSPAITVRFIKSLDIFKKVTVLSLKRAKVLVKQSILMPDEALSHEFADKCLNTSNKVLYKDVFLRWDEKKVLSRTDVTFDAASSNPFDKKIIKLASWEGNKTSDWWRQVGAVLVKNKKVLLQSHNQHVPDEQIQYIQGDPRDFIKAGTKNEITDVIHAEPAIIAQAANQGISLKGTDLYVNVFPCPVCAKLVAYSGIKRLFFATGSASLDGETILKSQGVKLVRVNQ